MGKHGREVNEKEERAREKQKVHLVNRLELLRHGKDSLNVVVTQFLHQVGDGGIILQKTRVNITTSKKLDCSPSNSRRLGMKLLT